MKIFARSLVILLTMLPALHIQGQETQIQYLSGTGSDKTVNWDFFLTEGRNSAKWTTIPVPSNWELQGFGKYNYGFARDSSRGKEKGMYKYRFRVPSSWKGKRVKIVFEGAMTDTEVKINGKSAGPVHEGSYYVFRYDISDLLSYDSENLLEATVAKHSQNKSVNAAERTGDFWIFGGIFRPVYLEAVPPQHIERTAIDAKATGDFSAEVYVSGLKNPVEVSAQLYTSDGKMAGKPFKTTANPGDAVVQLKSAINSPRLWSSEFPNLYQVVLTLTDHGKAVHIMKKKFGFRTVEVKERDGVYVNGVKVKFKGVCRHSFWPTSGRALNRSISIGDVQLMKDMNMNAVRMSHYPPDSHFLDACDSLGLFVMDELAGWHGMYDAPTGSKLVKEMMEHDVNHPSIVFWSNGNEGGHNLELDTLFTMYDPQRRPVIHPWQYFSGIETDHYREYDYGIGNYMHGHNITMPTEFLHGMYDGGHGAGLEDYWEAMWRNPLAAGGFLWDFADEGVIRTDKAGEIDTDGNHGADGIVGPYHEKEGSFYAIKEIWSPVFFEKKEITAAFDGILSVENRFFYTNISQCSFKSTLASFGKEKKLLPLVRTVAPDIRPGAKGHLKLSLPAGWQQFDVLYVTAYAPDGRELFKSSFPITMPVKVAQSMVIRSGIEKAVIAEVDSLYNVSVNNLRLSFNRNNGLLEKVQAQGQIISFRNGPVLQEGLNNFTKFTHRYEGNNLVITSSFDRKTSYNMLEWTIFPSGWVKMQVRYFPATYFTTLVGVNFSYPESKIKSVQYLGMGPNRVWKNRMKGNSFGVWDKTYNNTATGEPPFAYPEFKGFHSNMYWAKFITDEKPFTVVTEDEDVFLRLFTPKVSDDPYHNLDPVFPSGDISFMQGISGIGTKTQKSETTGPMGMKNIFYDYEKEPARAKVLTLYFSF